MPELTERELKLLLNKPEEVQQQITEQMSRGERRRLERAKSRDDEERARFAGKLTTRMDVVHMLALYIERNLLPLAFRLDDLEAKVWYMQQPFWKRWWLSLNKRRKPHKEKTDEGIRGDDHGEDAGGGVAPHREGAPTVRREDDAHDGVLG